MAAPLLTVESLKHFYGDSIVLDAPAFELNQDELAVIFGPNGSGKSTFLRLLALLERPSEGRISYDGNEIVAKNLLALSRNIVLLLQKPLFFTGSVAENIIFGQKVRRAPKAVMGEGLKKVSALFEIEELLGRRVHELSSGQLQRVNLARAFILEPKVLLLDEPFSALDAAIRDDLIVRLKRAIKEMGQTTLFVTHHREEAARLAERMLIMLDGRIAQDGPVHEVFAKPANQEVAKLIGADVILRGKIAERLGELTKVIVEGKEFIVDVEGPSGQEVILFIRPEDVILATDQFSSSIRNWFEAKVIGVESLGHLFSVDLDCGFPLKAMVTGLAKEELDLNLGRVVTAGIKTSSIHSLPA